MYSTIHFSHSGVNCSHSIKRCGRSEGTPYFFGDRMCHRLTPHFRDKQRSGCCYFLVLLVSFCVIFIVIFCGIGWALSHGGCGTAECPEPMEGEVRWP